LTGNLQVIREPAIVAHVQWSRIGTSLTVRILQAGNAIVAAAFHSPCTFLACKRDMHLPTLALDTRHVKGKKGKQLSD
jgi:hypothetical protein